MKSVSSPIEKTPQKILKSPQSEVTGVPSPPLDKTGEVLPIDSQIMRLTENIRPYSLSSMNSIKSRDSLGSVGFGQNITQTLSEDQTIQYKAARLIQIMDIDKQPSFPSYDAVVLLLTCRNHQKVATKN